MRRLLGLMAVMTVGLVACSSSGGSKTSVSVAPATGGSQTTMKVASAPSGGGGSAFCTDAATNNLAQEMSNNAAANPSGGLAVVQKDLADMKRYEQEAPSAIKGDVTTLVNFYSKFVQVLSSDQGNITKLASDMQGIQGQQAALSTAVQHVEAYYAANCHA